MSIHSSAPTSITLTRPQGQAAGETAPGSKDDFWGEDGFTFGDLLDVINPLQHIPIISTIYRELTGDAIAPGPRMAGGALLGGVFGFIGGLANVVAEQETGKDIGENVMAAFSGGDNDATDIASAEEDESITVDATSGDASDVAIDREAAAQLQEEVEREYAGLNDQLAQTGVITEPARTLYPSNPLYHRQYRAMQGLG